MAQDEKARRKEKPPSLYPLSLEDVASVLLTTKPEPKDRPDRNSKRPEAARH
jgi:hypothetical protein